ncbi:MAG TPA: cyclic nucleotide-binding domain-containing protein [Thermoanaerobaculia bacterium]|nr:cyclic nucleotide-binding domain-containing protein [Thermoanaerobaculia bacterium]HUM30907.1 cyclic nucleotide-binding domain-containing protein [Thermoanaerobaculia bacterium]HXK69217.1 cyclic nucleotide-binding domain-containing protein [Thermoanaerobaculia bacterium]
MGLRDLFKGKKDNDDYLTHIREGRLDQAIDLLTDLCEHEPKNTFIHMKLAECLEQTGAIDPAVDALERVVRIYMEDGYVAKAVAIQKKIQRLRPDRGRSTSHSLAAEVEDLKATKSWSEISLPPFFTLFKPEELEEIMMEGVELLELKPGNTVITEGETGTTMFAVVEGKVRVTTRAPGGEEVHLADMGPGDFFGEGSLLTSKPRTATVTTAEECQLLEFPRTKMDEIIARHPRVEEVLRQFFESRAEHTVEAMLAKLKKE